ncbi:TPA: phosphotransferase [Legionella pneumophila subsp. pneumophila]|nr:phosphotransferase [Legionella pneumophila subsp. pneumophila]
MNQKQIKNQLALKWALEHLALNDEFKIIDQQKIIETAYSTVHRITSSESNVYYLKQTPEMLYLEPQTITYLQEQRCGNIPQIIAENKHLNCFLMLSFGDQTLRNQFKENIDLEMLKTGILNYTKIQRLVENQLPQLIKLGIPDWRLEKFSSLYDQLIQQEELLLSDGLSKNEITLLNKAHEICFNLCESLSKYQIPETINHCDFHENNMILNQKTGNVSIIDWGETVIAHPFFSLSGCLWNITYFYPIKQSDTIYEALQRQCITPWLGLHDETDLLNALKIANQLNGVFAALSYKRIYDATMDQSQTVQQEHPGSIAGCLRSFLNHFHLA